MKHERKFHPHHPRSIYLWLSELAQPHTVCLLHPLIDATKIYPVKPRTKYDLIPVGLRSKNLDSFLSCLAMAKRSWQEASASLSNAQDMTPSPATVSPVFYDVGRLSRDRVR